MNSLTYRPRLKQYLWSKFCLGAKIWISRQAQSGIPAKIHRSTVSRSANPLDLPQKSTTCALFKAYSVDPKTSSPPSCMNQCKVEAGTKIMTEAMSIPICFLAWYLGCLWWLQTTKTKTDKLKTETSASVCLLPVGCDMYWMYSSTVVRDVLLYFPPEASYDHKYNYT